MMAFNPPRNNDAFASIRGFVYQIDRTILRWLDLQEGQELELERGEDIDIVWKQPNGHEDELKRKLEQVKAISSPVTLRSPLILDTLVSFFEHLQNNPNHPNLSFCYITNALTGREQNAENSPLINYWERIRNNKFAGDEEVSAIEQLREFFLHLPKPEKIKSTRWEVFVQFIKTADWRAIRCFIGKVEWQTGQASPVEL